MSSGGNANHGSCWRHVAGHDGACAHHRPVADSEVLQDLSASAYEHSLADPNAPGNIRPRINYVLQIPNSPMKSIVLPSNGGEFFTALTYPVWKLDSRAAQRRAANFRRETALDSTQNTGM